MESGNGGDTPALISNVEVLELLQKNLSENQPRHHHKRWKQRDWVQTQVVEYLKSTPCVKLDPSRRQEFQSLLQGRKRRAQVAVEAPSPPAPNPPPPPPPPTSNCTPPLPDAMTSSSTAPLDAFQTSAMAESETGVAPPLQSEAGSTQVELSGFGLTEAEALQILNFMPTEAVEIHLMVEDLNARLTPKQQDALLEAISNYTKDEESQVADAAAADSRTPAAHDNPNEEIAMEIEEAGHAVPESLAKKTKKKSDETHMNGF